MKTKSISLLCIWLMMGISLNAQTSGDFRTKQAGDWSNINTWQRYNGSAWVNAAYTPTYSDNVITIQTSHTVTVTATVRIDQTIVNGTVIINADPVDLDINEGTGTDLTVYGTIINYGDLDKYSGSSVSFESGSKYRHAQNGGTIATCTWNPNAECEITGVTSTDPTSSSYSQTFGHFTWNCPNQGIIATTSGNLTSVAGNFRMKSTGTGTLKISTSVSTTLTIGGKFIITGGNFIVTDGTADNFVIIQGDSLKIAGGTLTENGSQPDDAIIRLNKTGTMFYEKTGGTISNSVSFEVLSGCTLDLGTSILGDPLYSGGYFLLNSGAGLKTQHAQGITNSGASGCIQMISTRTFSNSANYTFYRNGTQATGNGLQTILNGLITIGSSTNATTLTITNGSATINNKLILISNASSNSSVSGTVSFGSSANLEYQGASAQTTASGEFPSTSGPYNLIINNANGVSLHASRTINGTLYLTSGSFSIGANTLTLNGALTITSGSLTGGNSSGLTFGGSGASAILPSITLNNLTINRGNGINLGGDVTTQGTLSLQNGNLSIGSYVLTVNGLITKTSGNLIGGNNASIIFGGSGAATGLYTITLHTITINRMNGVNMLGNVTVKNSLNLNSGVFNIGNNTLWMDGLINQTSGSMNGGINSNLEVNENASALSLPAITLNHLTINRMAGVVMTGDLSVYGNLSLSNGGFFIGNHTLSIYGFIVQTSGMLTGGLSSSMNFEENTSPTLLHSITLNDLLVSRSGGVELSGDVSLKGSLTVESGTLKSTGMTLTTGAETNINASGILWINGNAQLKITAGTTLNVNSGGLLKVTGETYNPALVTQNGSSKGYYGVTINSYGTIAAENGIFEYMDVYGISVAEGAFVDAIYSFNNCTFQNGEPGGQLLTIDNEDDFTIHGAIFPENTWGSIYNVVKNTDVGSIYFDNATGFFSGEVYENDPYGRINWSGGGGGEVHDLAIPEGWSGISSYIIPNDPDVEMMFEPILNELVMVYNQTGMYWPGQNINTLGDWNVYSGYIIKVLNNVNLSITGLEVMPRQVMIKPGWNLIPVFSTVPADFILNSLPGLVVAKGIATGEILWPAFNIQTLEYLNVGKSYLIYSTQPGVIFFPLSGDNIHGKNQQVSDHTASPWNQISVSPYSHLVLFSGESLRAFEPGDLIGGFTSEGLCAGVAEISNLNKPFVLSLYADDPTSEAKEGFAEDEILHFRLYQSRTGETIDLEATWNPDMNTGYFETNGLSEVTTVKMAPAGIARPQTPTPAFYPNPSHGIFSIEGVESNSIVDIFSTSGEKIMAFELNSPVQVDLTTQPAGIYFITITTEKQRFFEKLIIK